MGCGRIDRIRQNSRVYRLQGVLLCCGFVGCGEACALKHESGLLLEFSHHGVLNQSVFDGAFDGFDKNASVELGRRFEENHEVAADKSRVEHAYGL